MTERIPRRGSGANQEDVRRHNLGTVLAHLHRTGRMSRSDLTRRLGLNRSTIAGLVGELDDLGLARQVTPRSTRGTGRPSVDVMVAREPYVLAVDVRVDGLVVARVGLGGVVLSRATGPAAPDHDLESTLAAVVDLARIVTRDVPAHHPVVGLGIAVPGMIELESGLVRLAPNLDWHDVPFASLLGERLGGAFDPVIANDADHGAMAERLRGVGTGVSDLVYLSGEVGVGAGIITNGSAAKGATGLSGEIGHVPFGDGDRECHCGARGCWETEVGAKAIGAAVGCPPERLATLGAFLDSLDHDTPGLDRVGEQLGRGIAGIVNLFNPRLVVLGGYLNSLYRFVDERVERELQHRALSAPRAEVSIALPGLGKDSVLIGAAEAAFGALLDDPVGVLTDAPATEDLRSAVVGVS